MEDLDILKELAENVKTGALCGLGKTAPNPVLSTLKYFTDSRCGQGICHTGIAEVYGTGEKKNVQGGWHDAGDYGRYVVAGTKAVMDLLLAYKKCPEKFAGFDLRCFQRL